MRPTYHKTRVWDLSTRVFHWALVLTVSVGWLLGENLSFSNINWHFYLGYATGGLVLFRLIWGIVGPASARLTALFFNPRVVLVYLSTIHRRVPSGLPGHNPLGALSVIALLITLAVQVLTGLFAEADDLFSAGPLSSMVDDRYVLLANAVHETTAKILLVLVALHVTALVFYLIWKRENLIRPMITGLKWVRIEDK